MFKLKSTGVHPRKSRRSNRRLLAPASAMALVMLLAGNVSGSQLARDGGPSALVTPKHNRPVASMQLRLKLTTHAGRFALERG